MFKLFEKVTAKLTGLAIPSEMKTNLNNLIEALRFLNSKGVTIDFKQSNQISAVANAIINGTTNDNVLNVLINQYGVSQVQQALTDTVATINCASVEILENFYNGEGHNPAVQALVAIEMFATNEAKGGAVDRTGWGGSVYRNSNEALECLVEALNSKIGPQQK